MIMVALPCPVLRLRTPMWLHLCKSLTWQFTGAEGLDDDPGPGFVACLEAAQELLPFGVLWPRIAPFMQVHSTSPFMFIMSIALMASYCATRGGLSWQLQGSFIVIHAQLTRARYWTLFQPWQFYGLVQRWSLFIVARARNPQLTLNNSTLETCYLPTGMLVVPGGGCRGFDAWGLRGFNVLTPPPATCSAGPTALAVQTPVPAGANAKW